MSSNDEFRRRRLLRKLEELERTNPTDIPTTSFLPTPTPSTSSPLNSQIQSQTQKRKQTPNVRRILYGKKNLKDWLSELPSSTSPYSSATSPPPLTPPRTLCSSCGYIGSYRCIRCGEWSCDRTCLEVHARDGGCGVGG
ncbi:hypothetical protein TREMEDRAFT_66378 [Tremella mesenterica DSM 1558]|uniref:uncharacterized protein n=1 Tax=Tremella mesenterica (strain ATCC 24925 / CBS 8224 / DSM 1558 / NBRC 9311 / NRRL Y-6157 / RJB 2259-6 / UBC 559-6) TaxID=578456 RepID=UPI00032C830E|nr:uncharacterized protein TREMEDRAFT_66378 [Tremella mesenterica DSM 1558]EIW65652.1 hypothetical protein TREMEDRAFT_66378 [Tremella mesenterica DSM 1558]